MSTKPKLALISTWQIDCGIAAFAHKMVPGLEEIFDVEVFALDQTILKANEKKIIKIGDQIFDEIANKIKKFDLVNLQFEPGIFGNHPKVIFRRLFKIIDNSKNCYITFHTIKQGLNFSYFSFLKMMVASPMRAMDYWYAGALNSGYVNLYNKLNTSKYRNVFCHYHTISAERYINIRYKNIKTINFPLTFISKPDKEKYKSNLKKDREWIVEKFDIPPHHKIISCYGFISKYKGFETVINAIYKLPEDYRLFIFGSVHPNSIQEFKTADQYLTQLLNQIAYSETGGSFPKENLDKKSTKSKVSVEEYKAATPNTQGKFDYNKVIFGGNLSDEDFERAINGSDVNVMSYLEVGQTSSGPIAISLDLSKNTISTYNKCFSNLKKYAPKCFDQFDIGNHLQLKKFIELHLSGRNDMSGLPKYVETYSLENRVQQIYDTYLEIATR